MAYRARLKIVYEEKVRAQLMEHFGYKNIWQVPRPQKVCVTMGISEATTSFETLENGISELALIVGQQPCITRAKHSISAFGIRQGQAIGCKATLRGDRMWEFLDRFLNVAVPRIRDFRGLPRSGFDGRGNYSIGINDHLIFPELGYDDVEKARGLGITIVTSATSDDEGRGWLEGVGLGLAPE